jgi:hypothetical protein
MNGLSGMEKCDATAPENPNRFSAIGVYHSRPLTDPRVGESAKDVVRRYAEIYNQLQVVGVTVVPVDPAASR